MSLPRDSRPRLAAKARLRWDRREAKYLLLYPERGLLLNATAAAIVELCDGEHTVDGIVAAVAERFAAGAPRDAREREVLAFLDQIRGRGLLEVAGD